MRYIIINIYICKYLFLTVEYILKLESPLSPLLPNSVPPLENFTTNTFVNILPLLVS